MSGRESQPAECQVRVGFLDRAAQRRDDRSQPPGGHHPGPASARPLGPDSPHDAVHRFGRAEEHAGLNALLGAAADDTLRGPELGGGELGRALGQLIRRGPQPRHDHPAEEPALGGDAVERGRGAEVHHDGVDPIELDRRERVDDSIGADAERLVHVEPDRKR